MSNQIVFDIRIWEQIRSQVKLQTETLQKEIHREISGDRSLRDYQGMYPVPWQMGAVMQQRAESWIQRLYDLCCDAYKCIGKEASAEFDRAVWGYWIEPFIMHEEQTTAEGFRASKLFELLLCAVGCPPDKRTQLKVGQKERCLTVKNEILFSWQQRLLRLGARLDEQTRWVPLQPEPLRAMPRTLEPTPKPSPPRPLPAIAAPALSESQTIAQPAAAQLPVTGISAEQNKPPESDPSPPAPRYPG